MSANWFQQFLQKEQKARGLNVTDMAAFLDVERETYDRWQSGVSKPKILDGVEVLTKLGWNFERAKPNAENPTIAAARAELEKEYSSRIERIRHVGQVRGGELDSRPDTQSALTFEELWDESPYVPFTDKTQPVVTARVVGDSMAPDYPDRSRIAMRRWNGDKLPEGTPCVFQTGAGEHVEHTFKLLRRTSDGNILGWPLNPEHAPIIFRGRQFEIEYIVLGLVNPRAHAWVRPGSDLLLKPRGK